MVSKYPCEVLQADQMLSGIYLGKHTLELHIGPIFSYMEIMTTLEAHPEWSKYLP